ncbi:NHLP leader peptide family RiPP precursor [Flavobacterium hydrophilum]|uniref:TOMM propeptide domain-containing protein n=1 Tax=Flavobacterium hydrophilum TaxID=2211445 RepID=A0A2V4C968_9FLAO|nr:NHLP leader peptide family RiPP precursor [Flavobacterium hydrophilum]PXY46683.1 TOMM propeptide domain-containing protein [Flavobacterium hydrophilum]
MELINDQKILESIVKKAWEDSVFKSNLLASPVATLESFLGKPIHLPDGKTITVVDQSNAAVIFINIPADPNVYFEDVELSEEQLDIISGGGGDGQTPPIIVK